MAAIAFFYAAFTKSVRKLKIKNLPETFVMAATGELIRLINYVDDINTTLRRIHASLYGMDTD